MDLELTYSDIIVRLVAAMVSGALLGFEREAQDKPAGLRTNTLVALGAGGFTLISVSVLAGLQAGGVAMNGDPLRMIHGVAVGVGFLGAGAIMRADGRVRGLTSAAGIWVAAAVGVAMGLGMFAIGACLLALALFTLTVMRTIERYVDPSNRSA